MTLKFYNKENYVSHCRNLRLYMNNDMKQTMHAILDFKQSQWPKSYNDLNTVKRENKQ